MADNLVIRHITPRNVRVMVVCSKPAILRYVRKALLLAGFEQVLPCPPGEFAFDMLDRYNPDIVLMYADIKNPAEVAAIIALNRRRKASGRRTPKIFLSLHNDPDSLQAERAMGFFDIVPLPVPPNALLSRIETALTRLN